MKISYGTIIIALVLYSISSVASGALPIIPVIIIIFGTFELWKKNSKLLFAILLLLIYYILLYSVPIDWVIFHKYTYIELIVGPIVHVYFIYILFEEIKKLCVEPFLERRWTDARSFVFSFMAFYFIVKPFTVIILMPNSFYIHVALITIKIIVIGKLVLFTRNLVTDYITQSTKLKY